METLKTLPGDEVHQIMWRMADRYDLQMLVQSARSVARGPVAQLVANGARNSHEWTEEKASLLKAFDEAGLTTAFMDPEHGGFIQGPKNLALALIAYELSWVDAGAATCSLAGNLALAPIHERGTPAQCNTYMSKCVPGQTDGEPWRGAFCLTEPLPYVGVDTGVLSGKVSVEEWSEGQEPILKVEKRGRFITNMAFANFVTAAVDTGDERIKSSCMIILEQDDEGVYDPGAPTLKLVHQLSATNDPIFSLKVPASRIIGGYTVKDGKIVPNYSHAEIIDAVFRRTRVTVGVMTAAKLLSAVEPIIRYQRQRFRGGSIAEPGSLRHDLGIQQREDALHRLVDVWATGEAAASFGFEAARQFDALDPLERRKTELFAEQGISGGRAELRARRKKEKEAIEFLKLKADPEETRDPARYEELAADELIQFMILDAQANVFCPACKLWNTGYGATMMREAVSLMGGYGITEDCPGFLPQKWMDAQLEATYEGPEVVQRRQLSLTMIQPLFLEQFKLWIQDLRLIARDRPGTGACTLATAMEQWLWTLDHLKGAQDAEGSALYHGTRQGVSFPLADALCWLLSSRQLILDLIELEEKGPENPMVSEGLFGLVNFYTDLSHVQAARSAGESARICSELVFGYNRHPAWDGADCEACGEVSAAAEKAGVQPREGDTRPAKAGPCVSFEGYEGFVQLDQRLDGCLTGSRLAKDRAAKALTAVMIPEALDYPG